MLAVVRFTFSKELKFIVGVIIPLTHPAKLTESYSAESYANRTTPSWASTSGPIGTSSPSATLRTPLSRRSSTSLSPTPHPHLPCRPPPSPLPGQPRLASAHRRLRASGARRAPGARTPAYLAWHHVAERAPRLRRARLWSAKRTSRRGCRSSTSWTTTPTRTRTATWSRRTRRRAQRPVRRACASRFSPNRCRTTRL